MNYSDRFIKLPVILYLTAETDGMPDTEIEDFIKLNLLDVSYYHTCGSDDTKTKIYMKNGENVILTITLIEFEKIANDHLK